MRYIQYAFLLLLLLPWLGASASEIDEVPPCSGNDCDLVASPVQWVSASRPTDGQTVRIGRFAFTVPAGAEIRHSGDTLFLYYQSKTKRHLSFRLNTPADLSLSRNQLVTMHYADVVTIQFTKTTKDAEPKQLVERNIWRSALHAKSIFLSPNKEAFYSQKNGKQVAFGERPDGRLFCFVAHGKSPDAFVQIEAVGFTLNEIKQLAFQE